MSTGGNQSNPPGASRGVRQGIPSDSLPCTGCADAASSRMAPEPDPARTAPEPLHRHLLELVEEACLLLDPSRGRFVDANGPASARLGYSREELLALSPVGLFVPRHEGGGAALPEQRSNGSFRCGVRRRDGAIEPLQFHQQTVRHGETTLLLICEQGKSELLRTRAALTRSQMMLTEAQKVAQIGSWELDHASGDLLWSEETFRIFETHPDITHPNYESFLALVHPEDRRLVDRAFHESIERRRPYEVEHRLLLATGRVKVVVERGETHFARDGQPRISLGTVQDVTAYNAVRVQLEQAAFVDAITELPNRTASLRHLNEMMQRTRPHQNIAVINFDLDDFQAINDSFGLEVGNKVLISCGRRLRQLIAPDDWLARIGSDEFLVVSGHVHSVGEARDLAVRLQEALARPHAMDPQFSVAAMASAGVSVWPEHAGDPLGLMQCANTALKEAKQQSSHKPEIYSTLLSMRTYERLQIEQELAQAIDRDQLKLVFQPQVDGAGHLVGAEALLRWTNRRGQVVSPAQFIPMAERTGQIHPIGHWVVEESFRAMRRWFDAGLNLPLLGINVSAIQLDDPDHRLAEHLRACSFRYHVEAEQVELELTETAIQRDPEVVRSHLETIGRLGFKLAIDDFGTGYSSLEVLHRLPLHKLKIDRCFIDPLVERDTDRSIVAATIAMARQLGLITLAEGVENATQFDLLLELGCDLFQGFHFSRPLVLEDFEALLRRAPVPLCPPDPSP